MIEKIELLIGLAGPVMRNKGDEMNVPDDCDSDEALRLVNAGIAKVAKGKKPATPKKKRSEAKPSETTSAPAGENAEADSGAENAAVEPTEAAG